MAQGPDRVLGPAPVVRVHLAALDLVALRGPPPVVRAAPHPVGKVVEHTDPANLPPVVRADLHLVDRAEPGRVDLLAPAVRVARADTDPVRLAAPPGLVELGPEHLVVPLDLMVAKVSPAREDRVERDPVGRMVPVDKDPVARADPAGLADRVDPAILMDPAARVAREDHHRRPMCRMAPSTGVARNSAVRGTRRTASAHPIMGLRHRPRSAGSVGTTGLLPGVLRRTGTGRRPQVAGTVRRLPVAGTRDGTVRAVT